MMNETNTSNERYITLCDGTCMGDELLIFITDAPIDELKKLETLCNDMYKQEKNPETPIWSDVLTSLGYKFEFVDSHAHITPFSSSSEWIASHEVYSKITEHYILENQPNLR